jgi:hypothetical protein
MAVNARKRARRRSLGEQSSSSGPALSPPATERREPDPVETLTDTLIERVDKLVQARDAPLEWGNPLLSTTPTSLAVRALAVRTEALESAVRELALEVQKLSAQR